MINVYSLAGCGPDEVVIFSAGAYTQAQVLGMDDTFGFLRRGRYVTTSGHATSVRAVTQRGVVTADIEVFPLIANVIPVAVVAGAYIGHNNTLFECAVDAIFLSWSITEAYIGAGCLDAFSIGMGGGIVGKHRHTEKHYHKHGKDKR